MYLIMLWLCRFKAISHFSNTVNTFFQLINSTQFIFSGDILFLLLLNWCMKLLINNYTHLHSAHIFPYFSCPRKPAYTVYSSKDCSSAASAVYVRRCSTEIGVRRRRCHHSSYIAPGNSVMARCWFPKHWNLFTMQWAATSSSQCFSSMPQLQ